MAQNSYNYQQINTYNKKIIEESTDNTMIKIYPANSTDVKPIKKFGYCCEPKGIGLPIKIINQGGISSEIIIGKHGIFEFQSEPYERYNENLGIIESLIADSAIVEVWVPKDIKFTFDYATEN